LGQLSTVFNGNVLPLGLQEQFVEILLRRRMGNDLPFHDVEPFIELLIFDQHPLSWILLTDLNPCHRVFLLLLTSFTTPRPSTLAFVSGTAFGSIVMLTVSIGKSATGAPVCHGGHGFAEKIITVGIIVDDQWTIGGD
jgi:hypothetical protein